MTYRYLLLDIDMFTFGQSPKSRIRSLEILTVVYLCRNRGIQKLFHLLFHVKELIFLIEGTMLPITKLRESGDCFVERQVAKVLDGGEGVQIFLIVIKLGNAKVRHYGKILVYVIPCFYKSVMNRLV